MSDTDELIAEREWNGTGSGTTSVGATTSQDVNGLLVGTRWNTTTLSFSFPTLASQYGSYSHLVSDGTSTYTVDETTTFQSVNTAMKTVARWVLSNTAGAATFSNVSLLSFTENTAAPGNATLRIGMSDEAQPTAYAYYPNSYFVGGDVWMGTQTTGSVMTNPLRGSYAWHSMMHEIGHALGLKHGHQTGGPAGTAMTTAHDAMEYSIMTYRSYVGGPATGYTNEAYGYAQSLMMYDIAAIQAMYGARFNTTAHTYRFNTTTGEMFVDGVGQGAPGTGAGGSSNRIFLTIWDGSGAGTYDFSNYTTSLTVDLRPGSYSILSTTQLAYLGNGNYAHGNVYNALQYNGDTRSLIRTVYCGTGSDTVTGNAANNTIYGGGGTDTIDGGAGWDKTVFTGIASTSASIVHNANGSWTITAGTWRQTLTNVEVVQFTDKTVALRERPKADFDGNNCSDILWRNPDTGVIVQWNMNDRTIVSSAGIGASANWTVIGAGDFNGDGHGDLLWRNSSTGSIVEWEMSGTTILSQGGIGGDSTWTVVGTGDFGGDGKTDLLWRNSSTGIVVEWDMNGRTVTNSGPLGGSLDWTIAGTGDFNGDGKSDILWRNATTGVVVEWEMDGRTILSSGPLGGSLAWSVAGTGDFNGDGKTDLLWRDNTTGTVVQWEMNGRNVVSSGVIGASLDWSVVGTGDYNGDGRADLLWNSASTGTTVEWNMNGRTVLSTGAIGGGPWTPIAV